VLAGLTLLACHPPLGRPAAPPLRVDACGHLLPPHALLRLGAIDWSTRGKIVSLDFSPDGRVVVAADRLDSVQILDPATGRKRRDEGWSKPAQGLGRLVHGARFAGEGRTLVLDVGWGVRFFDLGKRVERARFHLDEPRPAPALSAGGRKVALLGEHGSESCVVRLVNGETGKLIVRKELPAGKAVRAALSPDGALLATAHEGGGLRLWDTGSWKERHRLEGVGQEPGWLAFSPDGKLLAAAPAGRARPQLWDVKTCKPMLAEKDRPFALSFAFLPGSDEWALIRPGGVDRWDPREGTVAFWLRGCDLTKGRFAISPDGRTVAEGHTSVRLWDTATGRLRRPDSEKWLCCTELRFRADGKGLLSLSSGGWLVVWDRRGGRKTLQEREGLYLALSPDGATALHVGPSALLTGPSGVLTRVDLASGKTLGPLAAPGGDSGQGTWPVVASYSHDGRKVAVLWGEHGPGRFTGFGKVGLHLRVFAADTGALRRAAFHGWVDAVGGAPPVNGMEFSAGGELLAASGRRYHDPFWLWDGRTGGRWTHIKPGQVRGSTFALSPDGSLLVTNGAAPADKGRRRGEKPGLEVWDLVMARKRLVPAADPRQTVALAVSPDGRFLAIGLTSGLVLLWDLLAGREVARLDGHDEPVRSLAFSPDGGELASASLDSTIILWDFAHLRSRASPASAGKTGGDHLWADLAGKDNWLAWQAVWRLAERPREAVALVRKRLVAVPAVEGMLLAKLIENLDSDRYATRESAMRELETLGERVLPTLELALRRKPSAEQAMRIRSLLARIDADRLPAWQRRALILLESIGDADARRLLRTLAGGAPATPLTLEAKAALGRLDRRGR
jgi:WD40 repeat protein